MVDSLAIRRMTRDRPVAVFETVLILTGLLVLFFLLPHGIAGDDSVRLADVEQLLHTGGLSHSPYSLMMPLVSVPVLVLGNLVESRTWWAAHFNVVVVAVGLLVAYRLVRGRVEPQMFRRFVLVLLFVSFFTTRLRDYNAEVLTSTLVALGILCVATHRYVVAGWVAMIVGVVNTPAAIVALALIATVEVVRNRRFVYLLPVVAAGALIMIENWTRRGGPFVTGYEGVRGVVSVMPYSGRPGFSYPFLLGFVSILFSFGRGLLFFTPGLVLWLDGRTRRLVPGRRAVTMMLLFTAGLVLVYSKWWAWYGGVSWGPRFFLFATIPASILIAARIQRAGESSLADAFTLGVLALSAWVAITGGVADLGTLSFCTDHSYSNEQLCWFTPDYSSLWEPVRQHPSLTTSTAVFAVYCFVVFVYLAIPLAAGVLRPLQPRRSWLVGWRA